MSDEVPPPAMHPQVSDEVLRAIGHVICQWVNLEWHVWINIRRLVSVHPNRSVLLEQRYRREFRQQTIFWKRIAAEIVNDGALLSELQSIIDRIAQARGERDWIAHGAITVHSSEYRKVQEGPQLKKNPKLRALMPKVGETLQSSRLLLRNFAPGAIERIANNISSLNLELIIFEQTKLDPWLEGQRG